MAITISATVVIVSCLLLELAGGKDLYWQPNSNWGIEITRVQIQELSAPPQIRQQREQLMATNMEREISMQREQTKIEKAKLEAERERFVFTVRSGTESVW